MCFKAKIDIFLMVMLKFGFSGHTRSKSNDGVKNILKVNNNSVTLIFLTQEYFQSQGRHWPGAARVPKLDKTI